jgi:prepilin-type N-terminal cleavage/methylation domain-containing protein
MQQRLREADRERTGGFTLIELLIVVVVLGILATIVVFGVAQFRKDATHEACKSDVKTVQAAYDAFKVTSPQVEPDVERLRVDGFLSHDPTPVVTIANGVVDADCYS